jgi:hypothetical protein
MFGVSDFWLETRVIIKKMIPGMKTKVVFIGKHPPKNISFFLNQNGRLKKRSFSISANSQYFFVKISWISPLVRDHSSITSSCF